MLTTTGPLSPPPATPRRSRRPNDTIVASNVGFTVVELLVVVAILAILMAILTPTFRGIGKQATAVSCRSNLHQISLAFAKRHIEGGVTATGVSGSKQYYPKGEEWPAAPLGNCAEPAIFVCPATGNKMSGSAAPSAQAILSGLVYYCRNRNFSIRMDDPAMLGYGNLHAAIIVSPDGKTLDFCVEDVPNVVVNLLAQGDDGRVRVTLTSPAKATLLEAGCGEHNCLVLNGKPMFPEWEGHPTPAIWYDPTSITMSTNIDQAGWYGYTGNSNVKVGQEVPLDAFTCDYGINESANLMTAGEGKAVIMDFDSNAIDWDAAAIVGELETVAARHAGTINVLTAGGGVINKTPAALNPFNPGVRRDWWDPTMP